MKKRLLFPILALVLICVLLPQASLLARAEGETVYAGSCGAEGDNLLWSFDPDTGVLTITGSGAMADYQGSDIPWSSYRQSITALSLPEGLTRIGDFAFSGCQALTNVSIPDSVTELGNYSFFYCKTLRSVAIPAEITEIPQGAFAWCFDLTELSLPEGLTEIGPSAFEGCSSLRALALPSTVTTLRNSAFEECSSLISVQIPEAVTLIEDRAFGNILGLISLRIPNEACVLTGEIASSSDSLIIWGRRSARSTITRRKRASPSAPWRTSSPEAAEQISPGRWTAQTACLSSAVRARWIATTARTLFRGQTTAKASRLPWWRRERRRSPSARSFTVGSLNRFSCPPRSDPLAIKPLPHAAPCNPSICLKAVQSEIPAS